MNLFRRLSLPSSDWLVLAVVAALPFEHLPTTQFHGYTVKVSYLLSLLLLVTVAPRLFGSADRRWRLDGAEYSLAGLSATAFLTTFFVAPDKARALIFSFLWLFVFLMYSVTKRLLSDQGVRARAGTVVLVVAAIVCLFGVYQYLGDSFGLPASQTGLRIQYTKIVFGFPRVSSVALEPLYFSNYLLVPLFLCVERVLGSAKPTKYVWLLGLVSLNIILGISRGAYLAALCGFIVFVLYALRLPKRPERRRWFGVAVALVGAICVAGFGIGVINGKKASSNFVNHAAATDAKQEASVNDRFNTYRLAYGMFRQHPFYGFGPSSFGVITSGSYHAKPLNGYGIVNNEYLELLAEVGAVGTVFFVLFVGITLWRSMRVLHSSLSLQHVALLAGCIAILIQYNFFSTLYILYIWVFLGWLSSFSFIGSSRTTVTQSE